MAGLQLNFTVQLAQDENRPFLSHLSGSQMSIISRKKIPSPTDILLEPVHPNNIYGASCPLHHKTRDLAKLE